MLIKIKSPCLGEFVSEVVFSNVSIFQRNLFNDSSGIGIEWKNKTWHNSKGITGIFVIIWWKEREIYESTINFSFEWNWFKYYYSKSVRKII